LVCNGWRVRLLFAAATASSPQPKNQDFPEYGFFNLLQKMDIKREKSGIYVQKVTFFGLFLKNDSCRVFHNLRYIAGRFSISGAIYT
jgi:hypothetical protein